MNLDRRMVGEEFNERVNRQQLKKVVINMPTLPRDAWELVEAAPHLCGCWQGLSTRIHRHCPGYIYIGKVLEKKVVCSCNRAPRAYSQAGCDQGGHNAPENLQSPQ